MLDKYVDRLAKQYHSMTPDEKRKNVIEIAGGGLLATVAILVPLPFFGYVGTIPAGYALIKASPRLAGFLQGKYDAPKSLKISADADVKKLTASLREQTRGLGAFRESVYSETDGTLVLDTGNSSVKGPLGKILSFLPGFKGFYVGGGDPLDQIEERFRGYLTGITADVVNLARVHETKKEEIKGLELKLKEFKESGAGVAQIMDYMLGRLPEIRADESVMSFFTADMEKNLSDEQRLKRRDELLNKLGRKLEVLYQGQDVMVGIAVTSREVFLRALVEYDGFVSIKPMLAASRDATLTAMDTSKLSTSAAEYVKALARQIGEANEALIEGLDILDKSRISSDETVNVLRGVANEMYKRYEQRGLVGKKQAAIAQGSIGSHGPADLESRIPLGQIIDGDKP